MSKVNQDMLFEKIAAEIVDRIYVMFIDDQQVPEGKTTEEQKIAVALKIMRPLRALPSGYVQVPVEPTEEMLRHVYAINVEPCDIDISFDEWVVNARADYKAMLTAVPQLTKAGQT